MVMHVPQILAIIPARKGSKGIRGKNMIDLAGRPLIGWTIEAAKNSKLINHIMVSTNSREVVEYANETWGVRSSWRPEELCTDEAPTEWAIDHVLTGWEANHPDLPIDLVVLMQATSPLRTPGDLDGAIQRLMLSGSDSLVSVVEGHTFIYHRTSHSVYRDIDEWSCINFPNNIRPRRQEMTQMQGNGSFWVFTKQCWDYHKNRLGGTIEVWEMDKASSIQIDDQFDLDMVEYIMGNRVVQQSYEAFPRMVKA